MSERFHVYKDDVIGEHKLDSTTPRPVTVAGVISENITSAMLGPISHITEEDDKALPAGTLMSGMLQSGGRYAVLLVAVIKEDIHGTGMSVN